MYLSLISPEKVVFKGEVDMVVVPGSRGDFGVLDRHAPFMTTLRKGAVRLFKNGQKSQEFTISGGFCEVTPEACIVLADSAE